MPRCTAAPFADRHLARLLTDEGFMRYLSSRAELIELAVDERVRQQVAREVARLEALGRHEREVELHVSQITDTILTLKCPKADCLRAFNDFDGCMLLVCGACRTRFCGWCLQACDGGGDPHHHLLTCPAKPNHIGSGVEQAIYPDGEEMLMGGHPTFDAHHEQRKREAVNGLLRGLPPTVARDVWVRLRPQLEGDLGIQQPASGP
uniref:Uncharacterized protein n=1 Tax=Haptolina brevifila TaxID=156173 RepID=A0A7S2ML95_9EUKA|mmetsp:Transcript_54299/g.107849  ORF Transcript_54299/g.107849 Transcript_54299/m.107849 type:complete len:206 (+) Transcript_54299:131-748(+)|eukprot:CAMPEP_0174717058 /NCGR_PEP_ID=MMETSP1094-20130205/25745_1 /TAXON_ID=156173 /ORGANISM="Chrysochromulina brevifilum, Strain UTEX LB 985" /LENGTH=205 /DNA_ID=CAMNT_0015916943 /DNA_START=144 /DNA_END=761 /DNA_ORIENTATION=-